MNHKCTACGAVGHKSKNGGCSPTFLASQLVISGKATVSEAASRWGVSRQSISDRLIKNGHRVGRWPT